MDGLARVTGIGLIRRLLGNHDGSQPLRTSWGALVLVIDDSPTICAVLGKMLGLDGYRVLSATDGAAAIEMARRERPTLIFLDVIMPGMNGFRVLKKLRQDPLTADVPIVMISGNQQASEQFYLQRCGADDFMKKPFDRHDVAQRIGQLVTAGKLARRDASVAAVEAKPPMAATMDQIPDIAMPDPDDALSVDLSTPRAGKSSGVA
ncbi:MAG: response regulator [Pseudomonadota bacterium]|nr:response regulator [Pseudomonadota bacterium]